MLLARVCRQPFHALGGQGCGSWERGYVLGLLLILVALIPLADASPPDPLWIDGIYDAADADDTVLLATSMDSVVEENPLLADYASILPSVFLATERVVAAASASLRSMEARAPPRRPSAL
jgi:hypothetical protein